MNNTIFMSIKDAAAYTGLAQSYIRNGCKNGSIPHLKSGQKYLVNVKLLLEKADACCMSEEKRMEV
jgi:excisionase family DNA binding protein